MVGYGYKRTNVDHCVYIERFGNGDFIISMLYVDDILLFGKDMGKLDKLTKDLSKFFDMKDL